MRASTTTSAVVPRATIDSRLDLPTPEPGEQAEALAAAGGDERVERAHAEGQRLRHPAAQQRVRRGAVHLDQLRADDGTAAVDRTAEPVEHAAEQRAADRHPQRGAGEPDGQPGAQAHGVRERHAADAVGLHRHDLGGHVAVRAGHGDEVADGGLDARDVEREADRGAHDADPLGTARALGQLEPRRRRWRSSAQLRPGPLDGRLEHDLDRAVRVLEHRVALRHSRVRDDGDAVGHVGSRRGWRRRPGAAARSRW